LNTGIILVSSLDGKVPVEKQRLMIFDRILETLSY